MEMFGDSDDDSNQLDCSNSIDIDRQNKIFTNLLHHKITIKIFQNGEIIKKSKRLLIISKNASDCDHLLSKLKSIKFSNVFRKDAAAFDTEKNSTVLYDIIIDYSFNIISRDNDNILKLLVPGGFHSFFVGKNLTLDNGKYFLSSKWHKCNRVSNFTDEKYDLFEVRKRYFNTNPTGAIYWASGDDSVLIHEEDMIQSLSVSSSTAEREAGCLSEDSINLSVNAIKNHGLCIISGLFSKDDIMSFGSHALGDFDLCLSKLREKGIDLLRPGEGPVINNFHELSMREALRCDLRNGKNMNNAIDAYNTANVVKGKNSVGLGGNPSIHRILQEAMYLPGEHEKGNWGRWNFEGSGPGSGPPPVKSGKPGAIISCPGCGDQTIHADTSHIYVHTHLPPHYINLFLVAMDNDKNSNEMEDGFDYSIGQTAFIYGSHILDISNKIMNHENGLQELKSRLIRPHLSAGDALLFDCRILHFGLANQSNTARYPSSLPHSVLYDKSLQLSKLRAKSDVHKNNIFKNLITVPNPISKNNEDPNDSVLNSNEVVPSRRPIIYVNYHHTWFHDPKNWNDAEKLF